MTEPEIQTLRKAMPGLGLSKQHLDLLKCILGMCDYMISCLVYGNDYYESIESQWFKRNNLATNAEKLERLGVSDGAIYERVLWQEMLDDFKAHATVLKNTYQDSEGLTYNSVRWDNQTIDRIIELPLKEHPIKIWIRDTGGKIDVTGMDVTKIYVG